MNDEKLQALAAALWPYIRNKIREEKALFERPKGSALNRVYIPEIDYLISLYRLRQEVKIAKYQHGKLETIKGGMRANSSYYCIEASEARQDGTFVDDVFIPTKSLGLLGNTYGVNMKADFRVQPAAPIYARGITDGAGEVLKSAASCYPIKLATPITKEVIENTREEWRHMTESQLALRLVRRTHMMEVLDILEQGQVDVFRQTELWRVLEDAGNNVLSFEESEALDPYDPRRLKPRKLVPTWMGDEV